MTYIIMSLTSLSSMPISSKFYTADVVSPISKTWSQLLPVGGTTCSAITLHNDIYYLSTSGTALKRLNYYDGTTLNQAGTGANNVADDVIYNPINNKVYYAGFFTGDGSQTFNGIVEYDIVNNQLSPLTGNPTFSTVQFRSLAVDNSGNVYFGGTASILNSSGITSSVYMYNGTSVSIVGTGYPTTGSVLAMDYDKDNNVLYVGGNFTNRLMKWNGTTWSTIYYTGTTPINAIIRTLKYNNGYLYIGGDFTNAGNYVAKYNTITNIWSNILTGLPGFCYSLTVSDYTNSLYMSSQTTSLTTVIYKFDGSSLKQLGYSFSASINGNNQVTKILVINNKDDLVIGSFLGEYNGDDTKKFIYIYN